MLGEARTSFTCPRKRPPIRSISGKYKAAYARRKDARRAGNGSRLYDLSGDDILTKVDRASMLASLEVRAPWLDGPIIEFAFRRVPARFKATQKELKILRDTWRDGFSHES